MTADVLFTTNPAEYTRLEGLYVNEKAPPGFIRGADLSTVGFAGRCVRGPLTPQDMTVARFVEVYGERDRGTGGALVGEVWKALLNKPFSTFVVRRVAAAAAVKASFTLETAAAGGGTAIARIDATSVGLWGNDVGWKVEAATDANALHWNLRIKYLSREFLFENLNTDGTNDNLATVIGDDLATLITVTKLAAGRPVTNVATVDGADSLGFTLLGQTVAAFTSVAGTDGTLAASDYISGVTDLANFEGVSIVLVPESLEDSVGAAAQATLNASLVTQANASSDRVFLTWSGLIANSASAEITAATTQVTTRVDRLWWCFNYAKTLDPKTATNVNQGPHVWLASILAQNDVDIHPGAQQTAKQTAGIRGLGNEALVRADLILLRKAGIATLEKLKGKFLFRSAVTTDLTPGKTEMARRRMADFLLLSAADRLRFYVKDKNLVETRIQMAGELVAFSQSLKDSKRVVEDFAILQAEVNTVGDRAQGIEKLFWKVKIIGHILFLVLEAEVSTATVIEVQAA